MAPWTWGRVLILLVVLAAVSGCTQTAPLVAHPSPSATATPPARPANPGEVTVMAGRALGNASQIGDFLGAGGAMHSGDYRSPGGDDLLAQAWRRVGFRHITFETLHTEGDDRWFDVTRDASGKIRVGFERYDRYVERYLTQLKARPFVYLGDIPRALSSQPNLSDEASHAEAGSGGYSSHRPRDLGEWEELCAAIVRHNIERFGLRGLAYGAPGEPDFPGRFRYTPGDNASTQLPNHIALYAATWRGVKSADPTASVGGPGTMNWQITPSTTNAVFSLEDWIRALARYNAAAGSKAVGLDFVAWQDYAWSSDRISDGAEAVSRFLAENGFDPKTPKMLVDSGWGSWSSNYGESALAPHQRASYIAHNLLREFKDPSRRQFALALYYFFYTDDRWWVGNPENRDEFRRSALVAFDTQGRAELTSMYAAFQMASAMAAGGEIVESSVPAPLEAMAVRDDVNGRVIVTVNNHAPKPVTVPVTVWDLPFNKPAVTRVVQVIDEFSSNDGSGLQRGSEDRLSFANPLAFPLTLGPYATVQISLYAK